MSDQLIWYGKEVEAKASALAGARVNAACIHLKNRLREAMSVSQPTSGSGSRKRGLDPSAPGEYPKIVTGHLRRNVNSEYDAQTQVGRVGTNVPYGRYLELGTSKMQRRPWLTLGLKQFGGEMKQIIESGKVPQGGNE